MNHEKLTESLKQHEGRKLTAYQDSEGVWTIGYGRNLQTLTISAELAAEWLAEDTGRAIGDAQAVPGYGNLDTDARRNVLIEMAYNLGLTKLLKFKKMIAAIMDRNWSRAADEMIDSRWAVQVGARAETLAAMMRHGKFPKAE